MLGSCCVSLSGWDYNVAKQPEQYTKVLVSCTRGAFPKQPQPLMEDTAHLKKKKNETCMQELQISRAGAHYLHASGQHIRWWGGGCSDFLPKFPVKKQNETKNPDILCPLVKQNTLQKLRGW